MYSLLVLSQRRIRGAILSQLPLFGDMDSNAEINAFGTQNFRVEEECGSCGWVSQGVKKREHVIEC